MSTHITTTPVVGLTIAMFFLGCGGPPRMNYDAVELIPAHGVVTLDGRPLAGAVVTFESQDGQFAYALTDDGGAYAMQFDSVEQGVTPGLKTVRIGTARKIVGLNSGEGEGSEASPESAALRTPAVKELVPAKYNENSELKVEVTPAQAEYDFDLTSR